ncbi:MULTISPECIES: tRNA preQ1(34) S-adenosylmethionine ribosyltransferase-isomerase QueA [unclassified Leptolyngbya]|uniref:tRNA preQ1(34) S-adenosylmethionine ribosyltransferase-isomerase QueA n=1 Tax=unclassified Leptolyngbya TaxID=2650499 RepID=UPI0016827E7E|nr:MULTISPECIES: tRNA preQ1(34) S-adenosylmethionine ribosyltransferase-isomerase QueA [unclassified Leptolyngbya]MBD1912428.1 tRNA preQ1(34) S-adenosylmethionine ribosyltransferase-isomerase QueA [Leptolyngbya sp. FACHB-8]MBD2157929.1 tRNA preQ1(34) S-adenosylmethionine ribosyltransferase-isomerase QueA [Leptolyngbya sp. FACHB-16]
MFAQPPDDDDLKLAAYQYHLPPERIAQNPAVPRDSSRLLVVTSKTEYQHHIFRELPHLLRPGDLLVMNDTRVLPARLYGRKVGGGKVELLLLEEKERNCWLCLVRPGRRLKPGARIHFFGDRTPVDEEHDKPPKLEATVLAVDPATSGRIIQFEPPAGQSLLSVLDEIGVVPLPPYITGSEAAPDQYQTVYANEPGSAAAPTAGLHFTPELLENLKSQGIEQTFITLHVGVGTFRPVEVDDITTHRMHGEWLEISPEVVEKIQETKARGGRVIAVGTTVIRSLEGAAQDGGLKPFQGKTELYIYPGYQWQVVDGLITNFHLPQSSLMMLVSAFVGRKRLLNLYEEAIAQEYRFYSFGDAMLLLPEGRYDSSDT